jgi:hypothetical protein
LSPASGALNGLEFVAGTLYGTFITAGGGAAPSDLVIVDPTSGVLTVIGPTGFGPISGLAYESVRSRLYGVTAGSTAASLVTINLGTGAATVVAPITDAAGSPLDRIGGLAFGPDGDLYGGTTNNASIWPNSLIRINRLTGVATLVGTSGVSFTGLTDSSACPAIPASTTWGRMLFVLLLAGGAMWLIGRRTNVI